MATSTLLSHSTRPFSLPLPKPLHRTLSFLPARPIRPTAPRRHSVEHLARITPIRSLPISQTLLSSLPIPSNIPIPQLTPFSICKWAAIASVAIALVKKIASLVLNPFFWMYFSWTWLYWPWYVAASVAAFGLFSLHKHLSGKSTILHQLAIVTSAITWLTLVPPAHLNGFLEGWPIAFFFIYHYFFFFESSVRKRLYGDLLPRPHDPKWDVRLPNGVGALFAVLVFIGHWLAAFEGPELHMVPGGWSNAGLWVLVMVVLFMRYHSVLYLANYSEKVAEPTAVVQFGPYRWVRHPIYASTMMLFGSYCLALRAPLSLVFLTLVCVIYYGRKAELEEGVMTEAFGERYTEYANKVRYRLIPFLY